MFRLPSRHILSIGAVILALRMLFGPLQFTPVQATADEMGKHGTTAAGKGQFHFVDLAKQTNQALSEDFHGYEGNNLKPLPRGKQ